MVESITTSGHPPDPKVTWEDALDSFRKNLEAQGRSPGTIRVYLSKLRRMAAILLQKYPTITLSQLTKGMIDEVLTSPEITSTDRGTARSPASLHRYKAAFRSFFSWATENGLTKVNPVESLKLGRLPRKPPRFLTAGEKRRLQKELRGRSSATDIRDRVIIEIFLGTGIRLQELVNLDIDDIVLEAKHLHIRRAKGGDHQIKFLKTNLRTLLRSYLAERQKQGEGQSQALFFSNRGTRITACHVTRRVQYWLRKAGINKATGPHTLRHTLASHLVLAGRQPAEIQELLGHSDITMTMRYMHVAKSRLKEAVAALDESVPLTKRNETDKEGASRDKTDLDGQPKKK